VLWELRDLGVLPNPGDPRGVKLAGSSAGALAIATYACGLDVAKASTALFEFAANCRTHGTRGRLGAMPFGDGWEETTIVDIGESDHSMFVAHDHLYPLEPAKSSSE
jgi:predicted acylesterase/phospholipase RssA